MKTLMIGPFQLIIVLLVIAAVVVIAIARKRIAANGNKPADVNNIKGKMRMNERLIVVGLGVLTVASLFMPWSGYQEELLVISDNCIVPFIDALENSMENQSRIDLLRGFTVGLFPLLFILLVVALGGWRKILEWLTWLTGCCALLLTFFSIGVGSDKLFGFYLTMLCGFALLFVLPLMERFMNNKNQST